MHYVDSHLRTIPNRQGRAIVGLSGGCAHRQTFFAFYVGRGDRTFRGENRRLHHELLAARVPHVFELYPGAHEQTLWNRHAVAWVRLALAHLAQAR